jgi:hypothetical protein
MTTPLKFYYWPEERPLPVVGSLMKMRRDMDSPAYWVRVMRIDQPNRMLQARVYVAPCASPLH